MYSYVVYSFNVLACEPLDAMEDIGFVQIKGVFSDVERAKSFASRHVNKMKGDDFVLIDRNDKDFVIVYYLSSEESALPPDLTEFNGYVVLVKQVLTDDDNTDEEDEEDK